MAFLSIFLVILLAEGGYEKMGDIYIFSIILNAIYYSYQFSYRYETYKAEINKNEEGKYEEVK